MADFSTTPPTPVVYYLRLLALLAWVTVLALLSLSPSVRAPVGLQLWDKLNHFIAYAVLAWLCLRMLGARQQVSARLKLVVWLLCMAYGLLLEVLQWLMALGRSWEAGDLLANGCGALAICVLFRHSRPRSLHHES
jgi:VanZ family protein